MKAQYLNENIPDFTKNIEDGISSASRYAITINGIALSVSLTAFCSLDPENTSFIIRTFPFWCFLCGIICSGFFIYAKIHYFAVITTNIAASEADKTSKAIDLLVAKIPEIEKEAKEKKDKELASIVSSIESTYAQHQYTLNKINASKLLLGRSLNFSNALEFLMLSNMLFSYTFFILGVIGIIWCIKEVNL